MTRIKILLVNCFLLLSVTAIAQTDKDKKIMADALKAKATLLAKDAGIQEFFNGAAGYAIFPNVGKGGLIIGGASGNGVLYENGTAMGMTSLKKVNVGLQAGGQAIIEIIFFQTNSALQKFKQGNYEFSAEASAIAIDKGTSKDVSYQNGVAIFTLPKKGLMADVSVGGQKFEYHAF
ncbi:lipid-binding SYLF domain-containing protein [Polaribacter sp.]|nr:lipid-binding SYLF domain-containing protein [Polaribacter sp.]